MCIDKFWRWKLNGPKTFYAEHHGNVGKNKIKQSHTKRKIGWEGNTSRNSACHYYKKSTTLNLFPRLARTQLIAFVIPPVRPKLRRLFFHWNKPLHISRHLQVHYRKSIPGMEAFEYTADVLTISNWTQNENDKNTKMKKNLPVWLVTTFIEGTTKPEVVEDLTRRSE